MAAQVVLACLLPVIVSARFPVDINATVTTRIGTFVGFKKIIKVDNATVEVSKFLGIPYAEPPVGELRFEKPVPKAALDDTLVVKKYGSECIQVRGARGTTIPASEDCLFLNIFVPNTTDNGRQHAVMIWIHGDDFVSGSANTYVGDLLAARGSVVVVTINYRLSVLGFLNLGGNNASNFGLWDQHMAIRWVHDNIEAFGGNKDRITIFGQSAGASSAVFQGLFPANKGLFRGIIAQSGSANAPMSESFDPVADAIEFASIVECANETYISTLDCLKNLSEATIYATINDITNGLKRNPAPFLPSIDNDFIKISPRDILNANNMSENAVDRREILETFDLMIGANAGEGAEYVYHVNGVQSNPYWFLPTREFFEEILVPKFVIERSMQGDTKTLNELVVGTYTTWDDPENPRNIRQNFVKMYGDYLYLVPSLHTAELYASISRIGAYVYYFTAKPSIHLFRTPTWIDGPNHGDELVYVFGEVNEFRQWGGITGRFEEWEEELSRNIMIMWTNFARTGDPNQPNDIGVNWLPYTKMYKRFLEIGKTLNETVRNENLALSRVHLWAKEVPTMNDALEHASRPCDVTSAAQCVYAYISATMVFCILFTVPMRTCSLIRSVI